MSELYDTVNKTEPTNYELCLWIGRFLCAIMLDNSLVLQFAKFVSFNLSEEIHVEHFRDNK
jgi:hypothetical protein